MIDPDELLAFAFDLARSPQRTEASARRAASTAYYALFHTLVQAGASLFQVSAETQQRIARSFDHGAFGKAARSLVVRSRTTAIDPRLVRVAEAFTLLQEFRERADYDLAAAISWDDVNGLLILTEITCGDYDAIREAEEAKRFVIEPLLKDRSRRG